jgi:hypothetical protein
MLVIVILLPPNAALPVFGSGRIFVLSAFNI